jgi:hypothetical protein
MARAFDGSVLVGLFIESNMSSGVEYIVVQLQIPRQSYGFMLLQSKNRGTNPSSTLVQ